MNTEETTNPQQHENPNGLHGRYFIQKIVPNPRWEHGYGGPRYSKEDTDPGSEYFIMRLDNGGSDPEHIKACRIGVNAYADAIEHHLPQLAKDLRERYPASPAIGGEAVPRTSVAPGPEGYRPDNQLLPQETTTQNIKTPTLAEIKDQVAQAHGYEDWGKVTLIGVLPLVNEVAKEYAKQLIEADRKDCAFHLTGKLLSEGYGVPDSQVLPIILNRPLPPMP